MIVTPIEDVIKMDYKQHDLHHGNHHSMTSTPMMTTGSMDHAGKMFFHFGYEPIVLFEQWSANSNLSMFFTCLFFFVMAIIYEILKAYRRIFFVRIIRYRQEKLVIHQIMDPNIVEFKNEDKKDDQNNKTELMDETIGTSKLQVTKLDEISATMEDPTVQMSSYSHPSYGMRSRTDIESGGGSSSQSINGQASSVKPILTSQNASFSQPIPLFASSREMFSWMNLYSSILYSLQVFFAYYLMLAFMLFNVWICLAIILGAALGHFLLSERNQTLSDHNVEDYCH